MHDSLKEIEDALEVLSLPRFVSREDIKRQYRYMAKKNHPDIGGNPSRMEAINNAYRLLTIYMDDFRYAFDDEEISKQFSGVDYARRFKV